MSYYNSPSATNELEVDFDKNVTRLYESISESQWDVAISDVQNNPNEAKTWVVRHHEDGQIMWRFLPIHSACARQPPELIMNALLTAHRQGASCRDDQGMLPLHYACGNQASIEIIRLLLLAYPEGATVADPNGMTPLHYISQWGPSAIEAIDVLLFANRSALQVKDVDGNTPMDLARNGEYEDGAKEQVIQSLQRFMLSSPATSTLTPSTRENVMVSNQSLPSIDLKKTETQSLTTSTMRTPASNFEPVQQTDLKDYITMPKTSEAVRRLQEAAAAQQSARDNFLRRSDSQAEGRDDDFGNGSIARNSMYGNNSSEKNHSYSNRSFMKNNDDVGTAYTMDTSTQRMVSSLQAEVDKLRAEASMAETEAQKQITNERMEMQKAIDEMKGKLENCEKETMDSLSELSSKEEFGQYVNGRLKEKENELASVMKQNEKLRNNLETTKQKITKYKKKTSTLDEHLAALSKSMESMMVEQEQIMKASAQHEEHMKKVSLARQQKMQELIDQEVEFARESLEKQKESDLGSEEMINAALEAQKNLMAAISDVLAPKHGVEDESHGDLMIKV